MRNRFFIPVAPLGNKGVTLFLLALTPAFAQSAFRGFTFKKTRVHDKYLCEGVAYGDFDKDGKIDIVSGPYWYSGPDYKVRHEYFKEGRPGAEYDHYKTSENWADYTYDFNGDGWLDALIPANPNGDVNWYENPGAATVGGASVMWKKHLVAPSYWMEQLAFTDINGDGKPELAAGIGNDLGYFECDWKNPTAVWKWNTVAPAVIDRGYFHGLGIGDITGDGKPDLMARDTWWEQPATLGGPWKKYAQVFTSKPTGNVGGAHMYTYDVDGDGDADVITSLQSHSWGLAWFEQVKTGGVISFVKHMIMDSDKEKATYGAAFSQLHSVRLEDMDGDGLKDIITGKSYWAHPPVAGQDDPDINGTKVVYIFRLTRVAGVVTFTPHLVDDASGTGRQFDIGDLDGDGSPDIVIANMQGLFVFNQQNYTGKVSIDLRNQKSQGYQFAKNDLILSTNPYNSRLKSPMVRILKKTNDSRIKAFDLDGRRMPLLPGDGVISE